MTPGLDREAGQVPDHRREARERALGLLYEAEARGLTTDEVIDLLPVRPDPLATDLAEGVERDRDEIDELLRRYSRGWRLERMPAVDRALLRMGAYELRDRPTVPVAVVIDEAVELAKQYSTDDSGRFVNGMLARIAEEVRDPGADPPPAPPTAD